MEYTNGEWKAERIPTSVGHAWEIKPIHACIYVDNQYIPNDLQNKGSIEAEANANLISAAPDMYEALKMLWKYATIHNVEGVIYPEGSHQEWINKANEALNKAEGK